MGSPRKDSSVTDSSIDVDNANESLDAEERQWQLHKQRNDEHDKQQRAIENKLLADLSEPFPPEMERELRKGGTTLTYIPVSEVVARLNRCFGVRGWSSEIIRCERDTLDPDFIVAHVRLTVGERSWGISKDGFGGQKIKRTKQGEIVDLGDEFKGAVSDALKKAAQQFGVGLYLARSDEALSIEVEQERQANTPPVDPAIAGMWKQFKEVTSSFTPEQRDQLNIFWTQYSGGAPKPTPETATKQVLMALLEESVKISFPGAEMTSNND